VTSDDESGAEALWTKSRIPKTSLVMDGEGVGTAAPRLHRIPLEGMDADAEADLFRDGGAAFLFASTAITVYSDLQAGHSIVYASGDAAASATGAWGGAELGAYIGSFCPPEPDVFCVAGGAILGAVAGSVFLSWAYHRWF
jgi:hypothetical protein